MADEDSNNPSEGLPPKPAEAPKIQPKKETVRISLPPKPPSTATIKLPSLPGGGPKPPSATPAAPGAPTGSPAVPKAPVPTSAAPAAARPGTSLAGQAPRPAPGAAPAVAPRPKAAPAPAKKTGPLDIGLAIAAGLLGLGAVGSLLALLLMK